MDGVTLEQLNAYISDLFVQEDDILRDIQAAAKENGLPDISVQPFEGRLLQFLVHLCRARVIVEIGTLAGYSSVWMARALPQDGRLYTLEASGKHAAVSRANFERAGLNGRIELLEGAALDSLAQLAPKAPFDMVFIDANKDGYPAYLAWAVEHLRPGGLVAAHNALRDGRVVAPQSDDDQAMADFNRMLAGDARLESFLLGIGDGLAVAVRK